MTIHHWKIDPTRNSSAATLSSPTARKLVLPGSGTCATRSSAVPTSTATTRIATSRKKPWSAARRGALDLRADAQRAGGRGDDERLRRAARSGSRPGGRSATAREAARAPSVLPGRAAGSAASRRSARWCRRRSCPGPTPGRRNRPDRPAPVPATPVRRLRPNSDGGSRDGAVPVAILGHGRSLSDAGTCLRSANRRCQCGHDSGLDQSTAPRMPDGALTTLLARLTSAEFVQGGLVWTSSRPPGHAHFAVDAAPTTRGTPRVLVPSCAPSA